MDAVVIAGGIPAPEESLYSYSKGEAKALLDVAGKPMVQWVLDALGAAQAIDRIVLIGLTAKSGLSCRKPLTYVSGEGRMLANIQAGTGKVLEQNPRAQYALFVTSDIPAITGPMVDWVVNTSLQTKHDLYYTIIPREVMEERFPSARRTFVRLKDLQACGADIHVARTAIVKENSDFWDRVIEARKSPIAQASILGPDIILRFLFRQLTADDVIRKVAARLGLRGRALISPFAELGMDVDKPHQLEILRSELGASAKKRRPVRAAAKGGARPAKHRPSSRAAGPAKRRGGRKAPKKSGRRR